MSNRSGEESNRNGTKKNLFFPIFLAVDVILIVLIVGAIVVRSGKKEEKPAEVTVTFEQTLIAPEPDNYMESIEEVIEADILRANQQRFREAVFLGDSLTEGLGLYGYVKTKNLVAKKGLSIEQAQKKIGTITKKKPKYIFVMLGINDMNYSGYTLSDIESNYRTLLEKLHKKLPNTKIYLQSLLPVTSKFAKSHKRLSNERIVKMNKRLKKMSTSYEYTSYVDIHSRYVTKKKCLSSKVSSDGYHLKVNAYAKWVNYIKDEMR